MAAEYFKDDVLVSAWIRRWADAQPHPDGADPVLEDDLEGVIDVFLNSLDNPSAFARAVDGAEK